MKGPNLKSAARGQAAVIGMALAALLLAGCSKREDSAKPDQRVSTATAGKTNETIPDWALESTATNNKAATATREPLVFTEKDFEPDTNNKGFEWIEPALTPQQIAGLKIKAEKGDAQAQFELGTNLLVTAREEAVQWFHKAAETGHAQAASLLASVYKHGFSKLGTNASLALHWLKVAAERGSLEAQSSLANSYRYDYNHDSPNVRLASAYFSWGTGTNLAEAAKWYRKAAEQGDADAQSNLGEMYLRGEGGPTNSIEGLRLTRQAIANWEKQSEQWSIASNSAHLSAKERQDKVAAAKMMSVQSCLQLAEYYYEGQFLPKDITNAIYWYEKAAEPGTYFAGRAQFQLGYIHASETKNFAEAVKWFRKRAEDGDTTAQRNLAVLYYKGGIGVASDRQQAATWYRKAAEAGNEEAQVHLAAMYRDGEGVPRDYREAAKWFRKAAEQGHWLAQHDLGGAYVKGEGVPRDYVEAYKWFNLAAAGADDAGVRESARKNLDSFTRYMTPEQIAEAQRRSSAFVARKVAADAHPPWEDFGSNTPQASGTAFFVTDDGYLLTSAHVVSPPEPKTAEGFLDARPVTRIEVTVGGKIHTAKLVKADKANDVAVLKISDVFKPLPLAPSRAVKLGETICTLGFPNTDIQGTEPKFTTGEINSLAGIQDDPRHFQISVPVQPGSSGGPLLDSSGNVIGLVSARLADIATLKITGSLPQNVNYALKSSFITAFLETIPEVSAKLKSPHPSKSRPLAEIADEAKQSVVLVTVY